MFLLTLIYALCFTAIKSGLDFIPPLLFGGLRTLIGGAVLLLVVIILRQPLRPSKYEWKWIFWIGLTTAVSYAGMFLSPGRTGAGIASIIGNMSPFFTVLLAALILHEKLSRAAKLALVLGVAGLFAISFPDLFGAGAYGIAGVFLAIAASGGSAVSNILVKLMKNEHSIIRISAWQFIIGSVPLLVLSSIAEKGQAIIWNFTSLGILLFLGVIGTAFVTAVWYLLIQYHDVGKLSLFLFLIPAFGLAIAWLVFREPLNTSEMLGVGLIFIGTAALIRTNTNMR